MPEILDPTGFPYSRDVVSDRDRIESLYRAQEQLRLDHNARMPGLSPHQRSHFLRDVFNRKMGSIAIEIGKHRKKLFTLNKPIGDKYYDGYNAFKASAKATTRWNTDIGKIPLFGAIAPEPPDPTENLTTYTEVDPGNDITVDGGGAKVDWAALPRNVDAFVYDDNLAGWLDGDFEHWNDMQHTSVADGSGIVGVWGVGNTVDDLKGVETGNGDELCAIWSTTTLFAREIFGGATSDDTAALAYATAYYMKYVRDENVGAQGTLYFYIYDDGVNRTNLLDTLTVALSGKIDFRYIFAVQSWNSNGAQKSTGWMENLDLKEAVSALPWHYYQQQQ